LDFKSVYYGVFCKAQFPLLDKGKAQVVLPSKALHHAIHAASISRVHRWRSHWHTLRLAPHSMAGS